MIRLHDKHFVPFINSETLQSRISDLSKQVANDLGDIKPLFVGILNGSFMFVSDFLKNYPNDCELSFIKLASYVGTESSQQVRTLFGLDEDLTGRTVVILEDIVDTGHTLEEINHIFKKKGVEKLLIATLFFKPESYKKTMPIDYVGFEIPNKFIVGFGLDYDGLGRNLPQIYQLQTQEMKNIVLF
ncbi:MAG: hypoxanthine phosphoribosyltransferase, partial [Flavobacteriaceae bacterium]|nr:hypoxanthine phosphoribosyltransferase [Flavobacteriaceae bacterium]